MLNSLKSLYFLTFLRDACSSSPSRTICWQSGRFCGASLTVTSSLFPPCRVCVEAPLPAGQLLQMDCLLHAWAEPPEEGCFREREALHVQSLSHWAPANIGPYSQALRVSTETARTGVDVIKREDVGGGGGGGVPPCRPIGRSHALLNL